MKNTKSGNVMKKLSYISNLTTDQMLEKFDHILDEDETITYFLFDGLGIISKIRSGVFNPVTYAKRNPSIAKVLIKAFEIY